MTISWLFETHGHFFLSHFLLRGFFRTNGGIVSAASVRKRKISAAEDTEQARDPLTVYIENQVQQRRLQDMFWEDVTVVSTACQPSAFWRSAKRKLTRLCFCFDRIRTILLQGILGDTILKIASFWTTPTSDYLVVGGAWDEEDESFSIDAQKAGKRTCLTNGSLIIFMDLVMARAKTWNQTWRK
jgi:hypothetical protein